MWRPRQEVPGMDTTNTSDGQNGRHSFSGSRLPSFIINNGQLIPAPGSEVTQADRLYPSFLWTGVEPQNTPASIPSTSVSMLRTFEIDNASSPGGASARGSSSHNQLTGASQPAGLPPAPDREATQGESAHRVPLSVPSIAEPQHIPNPTFSTSASTPGLSKTFKTDNISTLASPSPQCLSSQNQSHGLIGAGHLAGPHPTPSSDATQEVPEYGLHKFSMD